MYGIGRLKNNKRETKGKINKADARKIMAYTKKKKKKKKKE